MVPGIIRSHVMMFGYKLVVEWLKVMQNNYNTIRLFIKMYGT